MPPSTCLRGCSPPEKPTAQQRGCSRQRRGALHSLYKNSSPRCPLLACAFPCLQGKPTALSLVLQQQQHGPWHMQCQAAHDLHAGPACCPPRGYPRLTPMVFLLPGEEVLVSGFNIAGLLPDNLKLYFHYNGSLTTPPCYQTVKWTVFNQTMLLSHKQVCQSDELHAGSCPASPCKHAPSVHGSLHGPLGLAWLPKVGCTLLCSHHSPSRC